MCSPPRERPTAGKTAPTLGAKGGKHNGRYSFRAEVVPNEVLTDRCRGKKLAPTLGTALLPPPARAQWENRWALWTAPRRLRKRTRGTDAPQSKTRSTGCAWWSGTGTGAAPGRKGNPSSGMLTGGLPLTGSTACTRRSAYPSRPLRTLSSSWIASSKRVP